MTIIEFSLLTVGCVIGNLIGSVLFQWREAKRKAKLLQSDAFDCNHDGTERE